MDRWDSLIERITDIVFSVTVLMLFAPILVLAAVAIRLESKGPVFFLHERIGYKGKKFKLYKLRGMVYNALEIGPEITQINDPRVTKVGQFLRRTSIDEIPNFINVLKGEMCLVGPRPDIATITDKYTEEQRKVLEFKPGVTGISQINGRQTLTPSERVNMEIEYYSNATFWSDLIIIIKTFKTVLTNKGNI